MHLEKIIDSLTTSHISILRSIIDEISAQMNLAQTWIYKAKLYLFALMQTKDEGGVVVSRPSDANILDTSAKFRRIMPHLFNCENAVAKITQDGWNLRTVRKSDKYVYIKGKPQERSMREDVKVPKPFVEWIKSQAYVNLVLSAALNNYIIK